MSSKHVGMTVVWEYFIGATRFLLGLADKWFRIGTGCGRKVRASPWKSGRSIMVRIFSEKSDKYMPFGFDRRKAIQAVAILLKKRPGSQDSYGRLLKILYMADRESIQETGSPITGDGFAAMEHGTMLSRLYDLAARKASSEIATQTDHRQWSKYIGATGKCDIRLISDPGDGALCEYEIKKLNEVADRYKGCTFNDMKDITHGLPEYHDPGTSSKLISLRDFLGAVGLGDIADQIEEEARASADVSRLLGR